MIKLSILIPTLKERKPMLDELISNLKTQVNGRYETEVEVLVESDSRQKTVGQKRNILMNRAKGEWVCYIDDDDRVPPYYIEEIMKGLETDPDCCSLLGRITTDGRDPKQFIHSLQYNSYFEKDNIYYRCNNHLNTIRRSIAIQVPFPEKNFGEDTDFAIGLSKSGLLQSEYTIPYIIYYYDYISNKKEPMSFSQNSEDAFIVDYYCDKPTGRFIDIGAYHVEKFSNTRALYLAGWKGIMVEPSPQNYRAIADHYKDDEGVTVLNIAIGKETGEIDFYESDGDAVSTSEIGHMKKWGAAGVKYKKIKVLQLSVESFMQIYCKDIDFLSIDTEATNMELFRCVPKFVWEQISMICIEHDMHQHEIEETLAEYGFNTLHINGENIILAK
jgi:FkbM family methyltransferase